jgi:hypothetical protein
MVAAQSLPHQTFHITASRDNFSVSTPILMHFAAISSPLQAGHFDTTHAPIRPVSQKLQAVKLLRAQSVSTSCPRSLPALPNVTSYTHIFLFLYLSYFKGDPYCSNLYQYQQNLLFLAKLSPSFYSFSSNFYSLYYYFRSFNFNVSSKIQLFDIYRSKNMFRTAKKEAFYLTAYTFTNLSFRGPKTNRYGRMAQKGLF